MSNLQSLKQVFVVDGKQFETRAEAQEYIRRPQILAAMTIVTGGDKTLAEWLVDNQDDVEGAFDTGTIRRVTNAERRKLAIACEAVKAAYEAGNTNLKFLAENADDLLETFRYPSVKRMTEEEKVVAARNSLVALAGREDLADWCVENKAQILAAFQAGKEKREVSDAAAAGLAAYRQKMANRKEQLDAVKDDEEATAALKAKFKEEDAAERKAKAAAKAAEKAAKE